MKESTEELVEYIIKHKRGRLKDSTDEEVREWAAGHTRDFIEGIVAGINKDKVESWGLGRF